MIMSWLQKSCKFSHNICLDWRRRGGGMSWSSTCERASTGFFGAHQLVRKMSLHGTWEKTREQVLYFLSLCTAIYFLKSILLSLDFWPKRDRTWIWRQCYCFGGEEVIPSAKWSPASSSWSTTINRMMMASTESSPSVKLRRRSSGNAKTPEQQKQVWIRSVWMYFLLW